VDIRLSTLERILDALQLDMRLVPRTRRVSVAEAITQSERGRNRLTTTGIGPSDPQARLAAKRESGIDTSVEQGLLDANA
jgi:hypothetical protein